MKPLPSHDSLDELIAASLHNELTPEERAQFDSRLSTDPAARAAHQEAQAMHDLLEKTHQSAQPDSAFEQRMVSGVRRKLQTEQHRETALESLLALWNGVKGFVFRKRRPLPWLASVLAVCFIVFMLAGISLGPITNGIKQSQVKSVFTTITSQLATDGSPTLVYESPVSMRAPSDAERLAQLDKREARYRDQLRSNPSNQIAAKQLAQLETEKRRYDLADTVSQRISGENKGEAVTLGPASTLNRNGYAAATPAPSATPTTLGRIDLKWNEQLKKTGDSQLLADQQMAKKVSSDKPQAISGKPNPVTTPPGAPMVTAQNGNMATTEVVREFPYPQSLEKPKLADVEKAQQAAAEPSPAIDNRKLVRNAQLDLEVKSYQDTIDKITPMTKAAGGYVDTSHSEKGGNGKLQGTVVVKVLPQNLDAFLLKLRDLGQVQNQSVSTDDVTKDYYDTQARLENSRRMETQLQELLKHENGKVSDLLAVERELGRVRGEIEQMQGQLKLYDFQVQYATVTMNIAEKDLKQAAAYLLKEQDDFSLFATDVEGTFQNSRKAAEDFKAQVLVANLNHNSGSDVSALLVVSVPPDQIEPFLAQVRLLGRVANFTRQTQRVAKDGGDTNQPADQTLTETDKIMVNLSIRSDDESRKRVALTVVAKAVDAALEQAKTAALTNAGVEILSSSLNKTPQGESTAQLTVRVPGKDYAALIESFNALGRTASLSIQRNDNSGPGANGDDAPVIVSLSLTNNDTPLQETEMSVLAADVDAQAQQIKKDAATAGVEVKASSFQRQPDGTELAQMVFRLPTAKYPAFVETVKKLGKVESLSVRRDDRPDQTRADDTAPVEISLQLHNQRGIVADNDGLWATLRKTFGDGAGALFGSIRVIGVAIAFLAPWVFTIVLVAWIGRRIYVWKKK